MAASINLAAVPFLVILAAAIVGNTDAATHVVGDSMGWTIPSSSSAYPTWASQHTFHVGDVLVFNFPTGVHDVAVVPKASYDGCTSSNPVSLVTVGPGRINLTSPGQAYFICTFAQHCSLGQKLTVSVSGGGAAPAPKATPPPAPAPTSTPPPASTPPPSSTPSATPAPPTSAPAPATPPPAAPAPAPKTPAGPAPSPASVPPSSPAPGPGGAAPGPGGAAAGPGGAAPGPSSATSPSAGGGTAPGSSPSNAPAAEGTSPPSPSSAPATATATATLLVTLLSFVIGITC